ncbi:uncharacterized protein LOC129918008 [Episyrphus balteatus]|uniref:uncharacterized protein LOC129918008 n=1 Tax=Episyrphus balteatus TaxID=286459 RepID=UPI002485A546|nr:uncharacterized protein LOC129918008 [Episyrphus balteatus]
MAFKDTSKCIFAIMILFSSIALNSIVHSIPTDPVIINTVAQHYENPTLEQYTLCTKSRDKCINDCGFMDKKCQDKCQICPILIDQDILVQGINDTLYRLPISISKANQTNIIRLTNEIRNIIRTSLGNITAHNTNNITIYHKVSKTGGKYGLGYTEKGPCCHLIEPQRCRSSVNGPICTHRRQQTCGTHCISRVMRAKRVVTCSETDPDNCTQSIEYLPQPRRPGCQYTSKWPFISCKSGSNLSRKRTTCARCYQIPYLSIIRGQVPRACVPCFGRSSSVRRPSPSYMQTYYGGYQPVVSYPSYQPYSFIQPLSAPPPPPPQTPAYYDNNFDESNEMPFSSAGLDSEFKLEEQKCINEDGTVIENCTEEDSPLHLNIGTNLREDNGDYVLSNDVSDYDQCCRRLFQKSNKIF